MPCTRPRTGIYHRFTSHELSEWHTEVHLKRVLSTKENRYRKVQLVIPALLQSRTKLLGKVAPSCPLSYAAKLFPKRVTFAKRKPFPQVNVASYKRPVIRLSFDYTTTLLSGEGGEGRTGTATMFRKMLSKYTIFSTVLSKIVAS